MPSLPEARAKSHTFLLAPSTLVWSATPAPAGEPLFRPTRSDWSAIELATSPACAPPMPSETAIKTPRSPTSKLALLGMA